MEAALAGLTGTIRQRPPAYSAIKVGGRRAYALARAGETVSLTEREVTVDELRLVSWDGTEPDRPTTELEVVCSAGTYIRSLARDLGERVGSAAYLGALRRTAAGSFREDEALQLDRVREAAAEGPPGLVRLLLPVDAGLDRFPEVPLNANEAAAVSRGQFVRPTSGFPAGAERYRLRTSDGALAAIAVEAGPGRLSPDKVLLSPDGPVGDPDAGPAEVELSEKMSIDS